MQQFSRTLLSIIVVSLIHLSLLNLICKIIVFLILKSICQILRVEYKKVFARIFILHQNPQIAGDFFFFLVLCV